MKQSITVKAPAVIKLFGEHAVVYGKLSVAVALALYAETTIKEIEKDKFEIELKDLNKRVEFTNNELEAIYDSYTKKESYDSFIKNQKVEKEILPYAVIAGKIRKLRNISLLNTKVIIKSDIPIQKGLASSAACSTSFTIALLKYFNINIADNEAIELAREGDKVIHKSDGAGRIDISTSYYGGYVSYSTENGVKKEDINNAINLLLIDTGPKKSTAEMVGHVAELYKNNKEYIEGVFNEIEKCAKDGLKFLKEGNQAEVGRLLSKNHEYLSELGVSSDNLNKTVEIVRKSNGLGAKLSGGGGGGLAIALVNGNENTIINNLKQEGFNVFKAPVSIDGAKTLIQYKTLSIG